MDSKANGGRILCYEDGKVIFEEDSIGKDLYIIESGKVEICKIINGKNITLRILGKGSLFGENAMFADIPRPVTAIAIGRTLLISMNMEELIYRVQNNLDFAIGLMQNLVCRINETDNVLKKLLSRIHGFSDQVMYDIFPEKRPIKLGEILMELGFITEEQLHKALGEQKTRLRNTQDS